MGKGKGQLVLTRYPGESIRITMEDEHGRIQCVGRMTLLAVEGKKAKLGFKAMPSMKIVRSELFDDPKYFDVNEQTAYLLGEKE